MLAYWKDIEEELPKMWQPVFVATKEGRVAVCKMIRQTTYDGGWNDGYTPSFDIFAVEGNGWHKNYVYADYDEYIQVFDVTHWLPIPDNPNEPPLPF